MVYKFEPGDLAVVIGCESNDDPLGVIGTTVTILAPATEAYNCHTKELAVVYPVDIDFPVVGKPVHPGESVYTAFRPEHLRPKYDGDKHEVTEWDEDLFKPKELIRESA